jgi:hypothetical protein
MAASKAQRKDAWLTTPSPPAAASMFARPITTPDPARGLLSKCRSAPPGRGCAATALGEVLAVRGQAPATNATTTWAAWRSKFSRRWSSIVVVLGRSAGLPTARLAAARLHRGPP